MSSTSTSVSDSPVVLITGAGGQGIGFASAVKFAQEGYTVVATDIVSLDHTSQAVEKAGARCIPLYMDVTKSESVNKAVAQVLNTCGRIDVLVNNAANSFGTDILKLDEDTWTANVTLALTSVYLVTRAVLPSMIASLRPGSIVNVSSVNGQTGFGEEAYGAAKAGVINLTQNLAVRYGPDGIRCNAVSPGTIHTQLWKERIERNPAVFETLKKYYPLGRIGKGEDVAEAIFFLASEKASWITGTTLNVDGGLMAGSSQLQKDLQP